MSAHRFEGGCHCGNLSFVFEASAGLDVIGLRADQCSFCRAHNARHDERSQWNHPHHRAR